MWDVLKKDKFCVWNFNANYKLKLYENFKDSISICLGGDDVYVLY